MINIPEQNDGFTPDRLNSDYIFNWGIENKINVGLFYNFSNEEFVFLVDIAQADSKGKSKSKKSVYNDADFDNALKKCREFLNKYEYDLDCKESKNLKIFIGYIENQKNKLLEQSQHFNPYNKYLIRNVVISTALFTLTIIVEAGAKQFKPIALTLLFASILIPSAIYGYEFIKSFLAKRGIKITNDNNGNRRIIETNAFLNLENAFVGRIMNFFADLFTNALFVAYFLAILIFDIYLTNQINNLIIIITKHL